MKKDLTYIAVVLDRSGSMGGVRDDTIGGFNAFLEEQKQQPGQVLFTLVQFSDLPEVQVFSVPLAEVQPLTRATYVTQGWTALYDAIGVTIDSVGAALRALPEDQRPSKVLVMIQTDGFENKSILYDRDRIAGMIRHQREKYSWDFAFVGATESAIADAVELNIPRTFTTLYLPSAEGTAGVIRTASAAVANYRSVDRGAYATMDCHFFDPTPNK